MLDQALRTPESQDVVETPIVHAVILPDPANAAQLVPFLAESTSLSGRNALRILCQFGPEAVPGTLAALVGVPSAVARTRALAAIWSMVIGESPRAIKEQLATAAGSLNTLLGDRSPVPDDLPEYVERDLRARVCDLAYIVVQELQNPDYDQSAFRGMGDSERDLAISALISRGFTSMIS